MKIYKIQKRISTAEDNIIPWHWGLVSDTIKLKGKTVENPGKTSCIFLVHGIGDQLQSDTAVLLRSGFEDALKEISDWQKDARINGTKEDKLKLNGIPDPQDLAPPFIEEGYWANYNDIEKTFPDETSKFSEKELGFFKGLWKKRTYSTLRTYFWFLLQQLKLIFLGPQGRFLSWVMYFPLQITSFVSLTFIALKYPKILNSYLADVRLYAEPKGSVERAIVQRIDLRVKREFLELIGLDTNFRKLKEEKLVTGKKHTFKKVIWVSHSLGTVVSYNVLSDLFHKAVDIENSPNSTQEEKDGVIAFRESLRRFVTIGSPLDKMAYLFRDTSLRLWPNIPRHKLLNGGEDWKRRLQEESKEKIKPEDREWWFNFYHVLDPVSGALDSKYIFGDRPPVNCHCNQCSLPGLAHITYWTSLDFLGFILSRSYGNIMWNKAYKPWPRWLLISLAFLMQLLQLILVAIIIYGLFHPTLVLDLLKKAKDILP
ncbi:MAG: hypothetical protein R3F48_12575 [Candidatus Zixiibacteriota bacterium]